MDHTTLGPGLASICRHKSVGFSTFWVWGGPGDDAPHQAAVEQHFLGEAVVFTEMLQVLPPLVPLGWWTHGWNFSNLKYSVA